MQQVHDSHFPQARYGSTTHVHEHLRAKTDVPLKKRHDTRACMGMPDERASCSLRLRDGECRQRSQCSVTTIGLGAPVDSNLSITGAGNRDAKVAMIVAWLGGQDLIRIGKLAVVVPFCL